MKIKKVSKRLKQLSSKLTDRCYSTGNLLTNYRNLWEIADFWLGAYNINAGLSSKKIYNLRTLFCDYHLDGMHGSPSELDYREITKMGFERKLKIIREYIEARMQDKPGDYMPKELQRDLDFIHSLEEEHIATPYSEKLGE